jgi:hypothetical protein
VYDSMSNGVKTSKWTGDDMKTCNYYKMIITHELHEYMWQLTSYWRIATCVFCLMKHWLKWENNFHCPHVMMDCVTAWEAAAVSWLCCTALLYSYNFHWEIYLPLFNSMWVANGAK